MGSLLRSVLINTLCLSLALNSLGAEVEATGLINAHEDKDFRVGTENLGTLPRGTLGELIGKPEKLASGNYGIYMTITKISRETPRLKVGTKVWLYFNMDPTKSAVALYDDQNKKVTDPAHGTWAETTRDLKPIATVKNETPIPNNTLGKRSAQQSCRRTAASASLEDLGISTELISAIEKSTNEDLNEPLDVRAISKKDGDKTEVIYEETGKTPVVYEKGTLAWRNHNPGNIDHGKNEIGYDKHACFASDLDGIIALRDLLKTTYAQKSINTMFEKYAQNHTYYAEHVQALTHLDPNKPLKNFSDEEMSLLIGAIIVQEGYQQGDVVPLATA